jgi:hypothetical protein
MKPLPTLSQIDIVSLINSKKIDHIDFGCSKGGSLDFAKKRLGGLIGLGIDIDLAKVAATNEVGFDAIQYDIESLPNCKMVRFVVMSHFLEHLPKLNYVKAMIRKACQISTEFVYIQQPFFDADGYLLEKGLKLFWSDWRGHPNRMTSLEMVLTLRDLQLEGFNFSYSLYAHKPVEDSSDICVQPLYAPSDLGYYVSDQKIKKKSTVRFEGNVFRELVTLITFPGTKHQAIETRLRYNKQILSVLA